MSFEDRRLPDDEMPDQKLDRRAAQRLRYRAAVVPHIAEIAIAPLPPDASSLVADASSALARFDAEMGQELTPYLPVLVRTESVWSSEIEGVVAQARALALAELGDPSRPSASLILANTSAMREAIARSDRLDAATILEVHRALLGEAHPEWAGVWRNRQVRIGGASVHSARYVPPHHDRVPADMDDLVAFMGRDDITPLAQAAIAHAQFETIHPFPDGNGRVGRALIHAVLRARQLMVHATAPVSAGLLADLDGYFQALEAYRDGDVAPIVRCLAEASFIGIASGRRLAQRLLTVLGHWEQRITSRSDSTAWPLARLLLRHPAVDSKFVQSAFGVSQPVADRAIAQLVDAAVLVEVSGYRRNRRWIAPDVIATFDDFAHADT